MQTIFDLWKPSPNDNMSTVEYVRFLYEVYNLNTKEKQACDMFHLNPDVKTAIKALMITPKAWIFIGPSLHSATKREKNTIIGCLRLLIEVGELSRWYMRKLVEHDYLANLTTQLSASEESVRLRSFIREYEMEKALKRTKD